jgi:DNA-directed RNA polymerase sigma subunit (sigma70/sigma32)
MPSKLKTKEGLKDYLLLMNTLQAQQDMDAQELGRLLQDWKQGDEGAFRSLVEAFLPRVIAWVSPRRGEGPSFQDLIAMGNAAMMAGLKKAQAGDAGKLETKLCQAVHDALDSALKLNS